MIWLLIPYLLVGTLAARHVKIRYDRKLTGPQYEYKSHNPHGHSDCCNPCWYVNHRIRKTKRHRNWAILGSWAAWPLVAAGFGGFGLLVTLVWTAKHIGHGAEIAVASPAGQLPIKAWKWFWTDPQVRKQQKSQERIAA